VAIFSINAKAMKEPLNKGAIWWTHTHLSKHPEWKMSFILAIIPLSC